MPTNVKLLIKIFLGEKLCIVEAVSWWKYGSQVFLFCFKQLYPRPMSSLSAALFLAIYFYTYAASLCLKKKHAPRKGRRSFTNYKQLYKILNFLI